MPKHMVTSQLRKLSSCARLTLTLPIAVLILGLWADAQRRSAPRTSTPTGFDDVVFAISFSPDSKTLAIARGAGEPAQRYGRIELWDTDTGKLRRVIKGFDGPVRSISFSPDGQTLVSGSSEYHSSKIQEKARSRDGSVIPELKWWDSKTGELKHKLTMPGEGSSFFSATHSPDGKQLAVAESFLQWSLLPNGSPFDLSNQSIASSPFPSRSTSTMFVSANVKLLDAQTGELNVKINTGQAGPPVFSPNNELLSFANGDQIKLWNARTGKEEHKLKGFKGRVNAMAFSPDGQILAVASTHYDRQLSRRYIKIIGKSEVRVFDVRTWKMTLRLQNVGAVNSLAFNPNGRVLLIGGLIGQKETEIPGVKLFDLQTGNSATLPTGGEDFSEAVDSLVLSKSGGLLAFRAGRATVKMLDTQRWRLRQTWDANSAGNSVERPVSRFLLSVKRVLAIAFSADGTTLSGETDQGEIKLWDPRTGEVKKQLGDNEDSSMVAVSGDGGSFAEISDGKLLLRAAGSGERRNLPLPGGRPASTVAFSPNGQTLAVGSGNDIVLLNASTGQATGTLTSHQSAVDRLAFSDDDRMLASAEENGTIEIWNLANARADRTITAGARITALRFAPNGLTLAGATEPHTVVLWNVQTGLPQEKLQKHDATVNALAFSSDGQLLASGSDDRTVIIWETASGKSKRTLKGHDQTVTSLAFSPDGAVLASGGGNAAVAVWEVRTGKLNRVLR
jgi:WD40 repeat protein